MRRAGGARSQGQQHPPALPIAAKTGSPHPLDGHQRWGDRAPLARRIASCARSYVWGFARVRLGARRAIASYQQGDRGACHRRYWPETNGRSEQSSRCAARAALDLKGNNTLPPCPLQQKPDSDTLQTHIIDREIERRSRGASRALLAPTFGDLRAYALAHGALSRRTNKAVARACHRRYGPETNVGASKARDAPHGRRSISTATTRSRPTHCSKTRIPTPPRRTSALEIPSAARAAHRELCSLLRLGVCARTPWRMARYRVVPTKRSRAPVTDVTGPKQT